MVKSGLEKIILKFHVPLQRYLLTIQRIEKYDICISIPRVEYMTKDLNINMIKHKGLFRLVPFSVYLQTEIPVRAGRLLWAAEIRFPQFCVGDAFSALWLTHNFSCFQEKIGVLGIYFPS